MAGGADDEVPPIHKGIGALDDIPAAIVLCGREAAQRDHLGGVEVADGKAPSSGTTGLSKLSKKMAGEALGLIFSMATLTSGSMPMGRTASVESVL